MDPLFFEGEEDYVPEDVEEEDEGYNAAPVDGGDDGCQYKR